ncbi:3-keto-5-aminohexanoate cleavage protein [Kribbella sp. NPDC051587]|uniref:3-keto-5-aminohexanoate cleavage protein n=1 Tax=Kribbella sp. NPDC051587 TaxID=3364119 RepID=UPI0037B65DFA
MIKACLNGDRTRADHPGVPITPDELAHAAAAAVQAGADALHLHPRGTDELESLHWPEIRAAVDAVRTACPGVSIGVSTREPIVPDLTERLRLIADWEPGPDFASVNFHEPGACEVADLLITRGIAVEAGLFTPEAAATYLTWSGPTLRILVEAIPTISPGPDGPTAAQSILAALPPHTPALVHGENHWAWPTLHWARAHRHDLRLGLEDTLTGPNNEPIISTADLFTFL